MVYCFDCAKEVPDNQIGLINFGLIEHKCPARLFEHCPHCGKDLDTFLGLYSTKMKKISPEELSKILDQVG